MRTTQVTQVIQVTQAAHATHAVHVTHVIQVVRVISDFQSRGKMGSEMSMEVDVTTETATQAATTPLAASSLLSLSLFRTHLQDNDYSLRTVTRYVTCVEDFFDWLSDILGPGSENLSPAPRDASAYRNYMLGKGLAASTVNQALAAIKAYARWQVETGTAERDWAEKVKMIEVQYTPKMGLTRNDYHRLMRLLEDNASRRDMAAFALMLGCGLRREETAEVLVKDLVFDAGVRQSGQLWVRGGKGLKAREIPLALCTPWAVTALKQAVVGEEDDSTLLGLTESGVRALVVRWSEKVHLPMSPHLLRRTFGQMQRKERPIETVRRLMGHRSLETTAIYTDTPEGNFEDTPGL